MSTAVATQHINQGQPTIDRAMDFRASCSETTSAFSSVHHVRTSGVGRSREEDEVA